MSDLQDAIDTVEQMDLFYSSVALNRVVAAAKNVVNPNYEEAAHVAYRKAWKEWWDDGNGLENRDVAAASLAVVIAVVDAALTGDTE